jgi:dihydroneopterin aldolase
VTHPVLYEVQAYRKRIVIGCAPDEQAGPPQEVVFDLVAALPPMAQLLTDVWDPVFDYCCLTDAVDEACAVTGVKILQEALAFDVMGRVFHKSPLVETLEVATRKTERYQNTNAIGFRIKMSRTEWQAMHAAIQAAAQLKA